MIHIFPWFLWRDEYENIVTSREKLDLFVQEKLPGYKINPVAGDGTCMLHPFHKGINTALEKATNWNYYKLEERISNKLQKLSII